VIDDLNICLDEKYVDETTIASMKNDANTLIARINSYVAYLRKNIDRNE
jgi:hypothetical protein